MAKGSVRKKGKKWYYRFYVEDQSGNLVQKEYAGTESKSETEKLLRQAGIVRCCLKSFLSCVVFYR